MTTTIIAVSPGEFLYHYAALLIMVLILSVVSVVCLAFPRNLQRAAIANYERTKDHSVLGLWPWWRFVLSESYIVMLRVMGAILLAIVSLLVIGICTSTIK